jgi:hypothetical protein
MLAVEVEPTQVTPTELASFTRQLGAMLDAGVNVLRALRIASQHTGNSALVEVARDVARRLEDGREFYQAIAPHPETFSPFYVEMARQGEADGVLGKALLSVADYLDRVAAGPGSAEPPVPLGVGNSSLLVAVIATLGVLALGAAVIWALAAPMDLVPLIWLGPIAVFWSAVCLLSGAWIMNRIRQANLAKQAVNKPKLPQKSVERRKAEAEGVVRNALLEEEERREVIDLSKWPKPNGRASAEDPFDPAYNPEHDPPRFDL